MNRYMVAHTIGPNSLNRQQVEEISSAMQQDPVLRGYRSFANLSDGKVVCVIESPDQSSVTDWFRKAGVPVDWIAKVELEGERGQIRDSSQLGIGAFSQAGAAAPA